MSHLFDADRETIEDPESYASTSLKEGERLVLRRSRRKSNSQHPEFIEGSKGRFPALGIFGWILSNIGFRKTKPPSGFPAISWDEKLLSWSTDINIHNPLPENELEEKVRKK
jgi:hypothetical protein